MNRRSVCESTVEEAALDRLEELGQSVLHCLDIAGGDHR